MSIIADHARAVVLTGTIAALLGATLRVSSQGDDGAPAEPVGTAPPTTAASTPQNPGHEATFFAALNRDAARRDEALDALRTRVHAEPADARAVLLLGVAHLWVAAENPPEDARALEHLVLARHYLARAATLNPKDDRIPTWLLSAEISVAHAEGRGDDAARSLAALRAHAQQDPCFHSVAFAINVWDEPRESDALAEAQQFLEQAAACNTDDPSVRNMERWPYNVQGFLVGMSDVALKRGDRNRAMAALVAAESWPGTDTWPHRAQVETRRREFDDRAARFADEDPANDPAFIFERGGPVSCVSCHQGSGG